MLFVAKKTWVFLKNYWYIPAILIGIIVLTLAMRSKGAKTLIDVLKFKIKKQQEEQSEILKIEQERIKKKKEVQLETEKKISEIKEKYKTEREQLDKEKQQLADEIFDRHNGDPDALAKELSDLTGILTIRID